MISTNYNINKVGKYLYKHIDSAYKYKISSNMYDVYIKVLYQIPMLSKKPRGGTEYSDVYEMVIDINISTYQNKLRINLIEVDPDELTLDHFTVEVKGDADAQLLSKKILARIEKRLNKLYDGYEFIF